MNISSVGGKIAMATYGPDAAANFAAAKSSWDDALATSPSGATDCFVAQAVDFTAQGPRRSPGSHL